MGIKIKLLAPGPLKFPFVIKGLEYYAEKIEKFVELKMIFPKVKTTGLKGEQRVKKEGEVLKKHLKDDEYLFVLDERGKTYTSIEFAKHLERLFLSYSRMCFIVGGPEGISSELKNRANELLSFSTFTLNHEITLLILAEQIYRCFSILKGSPYHRE